MIHLLIRRAILGALLLALVPHAAAQCPTFTFTELFVDPCRGDDDGDGSETDPFETLTRALDQALMDASATDPHVVWAMPGIYSPATNGESLPLDIPPFTHVISSRDAKETVISDLGADPLFDSSAIYYPVRSAPAGTRVTPGIVLVDFSRNLGPGVRSIQGFTFQGGDVQVMARAEGAINGRISNCVFDMRGAVQFGLLTVSIYNVLPPYLPIRFSVLNNTFVQGWWPTGELGHVDGVGICDVGEWDPQTGAFDTNQTLRGVNAHNIQNNVFRSLPGQPRTAMLGIDGIDAAVGFGTPTGPSNAFWPLSVGISGVNPVYESIVTTLLPPTPRVALSGSLDPGFVGEYLDTTGDYPYNVRDWRLLPSSPLVDMGGDPLFVPNDACTLRLGSVSGVNHDEPVDPSWLIRSYRWDGEGWGNPRIAGGRVDIGFDEADSLAIAGSFANDSRSHDDPCTCDAGQGDPLRNYILPGDGFGFVLATGADYGSSPAWSQPPGTGDRIPLGGGFGTLYLDPAFLFFDLCGTGACVVSAVNWTNPIDGRPHAFGRFLVPLSVPPLPCAIINTQVAWIQFGPTGQVNVQLFSNLQSEYF